MTRQGTRSISALALLSLLGCTAGPFLANIEPLGNGKVRITEARVGLLFSRDAFETYELNLDLNLVKGTPVTATGIVSRVDATGKRITIKLRRGWENLKSGDRFAIFNSTDGYKGEATVREVDSGQKLCLARLTFKQGDEVKTGDLCSTNLSRSTRSLPRLHDRGCVQAVRPRPLLRVRWRVHEGP